MNTVSGTPFKKLPNRSRKSFLHLVGTGLTDGPYLIVLKIEQRNRGNFPQEVPSVSLYYANI